MLARLRSFLNALLRPSRMEENMRYEMTPHPVEFDMYYSV